MAARVETKAVLVSTPRLLLREIDSRDESAVHEYASDPAVTNHLCWGPNERDQTRAFIAQALRSRNARPRTQYDLVIERREKGDVIGGCGIRLTGADRAWEIGYTFRRDCWGRGYGREAVEALARFGFETLDAVVITAEVFVENQASSRILTRLGFRGLRRTDRYIAARGRQRRIMRYFMARGDAPPDK